LTANLTAKRTDAGGIGDLARTPKPRLSWRKRPGDTGRTLPSRSLICGFSVRFRGGSPLYGDQL